MKKTSKILALALVAVMLLTSLMGISASAASNIREVNFGELTAGKTTDAELVAGTGIYAFAGMTIDSNSKTVDGVKYTQRLKLPGSMKIDSNYVKFDTEGPAKVIVVAISGNSSEVRPLKLTKLVDGKLNDVASYDIPGDAAGKYEFEIKEAGTYYLGSGKSGINLYYISIEDIEVCKHTGGTATCKDLAVCDLCGKPYGELSTEHKFDNGSCTVCGEADPDACQHTDKAPATCVVPETCNECGETFGSALGHTPVEDAAVAPNCTEAGKEAGSHCSTCNEVLVKQEEVPALGHTLTFVNTLPTGELKGKTTASCSVCDFTFESDEVGVMGAGTYTLDASKLAGIAQNSLFDGEVKVVDGVFACHLSYKYRTDENVKSWIDYDSTHRMNFGGKSELLNNGEGDDAVKNGGLKNFIQITTTGETTITIYWNAGGAGREVAVYDLEGNIVKQSNINPTDNKVIDRTVFELPAGTYLIGNVVNQNYFHNVVVNVHEHEWNDATCESPKYCDCGAEEGDALGHDMGEATCTSPASCKREGCTHTEGEALGHKWTDATCESAKTCSVCNATEGEALGHDYVDGVCTRCEAADPDYVAPTVWEKIVLWFTDLIAKIVAWFKGLAA